ncbi:MAG TPA: hypothetical protein VFS77_02265 [Pyrinomonadaceae bacterium]|nr:hypothetical protein [Pyrinomonadaceae bacterium]
MFWSKGYGTKETEGNHLRHSRFVALRDDKLAREVVKESHS